MRARRLPAVVVIVVVLVALAIADHRRTPPSRTDTIASTALMPMTSPPGAVSSSFYCAGGAASTDSVFDATVVLANPDDQPAAATVTAYPAAASTDDAGQTAVAALKPVAKGITVPARGRAEVHLADLQVSPFAAALVETNGPDIAVERRVAGKVGAQSSPCASAPSSNWVVPTGTTTRDAHEFLAVFNPFAVDAVVDVTLQTSDGFRSPEGLQGLPVAGGHLRVVDLAAEVPRLEHLTAFVAARSGEVVVDRLQSFDGSDANHPAGAAATVAAPAAAPVWLFPEGEVADGLKDTITIANPGDQPTDAQVEITLEDPAKNGSVDPIPATVPARGYVQVPMQDQTRVPKGVAFASVVRTLRGPGVVAERVVQAASPAPRRGYAPALGAPLVATKWLFADGRAVANSAAEFLVAYNPSTTAATLSVTALAQGQLLAVEGLQDVSVPAGARVAIELGAHVNRPDLTLLVSVDHPLVVERGIYAASGPGASMSMGIPVATTTAPPPSTPPPPPAPPSTVAANASDTSSSATTTTAPPTTAPPTTAPPPATVSS